MKGEREFNLTPGRCTLLWTKCPLVPVKIATIRKNYILKAFPHSVSLKITHSIWNATNKKCTYTILSRVNTWLLLTKDSWCSQIDELPDTDTEFLRNTASTLLLFIEFKGIMYRLRTKSQYIQNKTKPIWLQI